MGTLLYFKHADGVRERLFLLVDDDWDDVISAQIADGFDLVDEVELPEYDLRGWPTDRPFDK